MSAIRRGYADYIDPYTRQPIPVDMPPLTLPPRQPEPVVIVQEPREVRGKRLATDAEVIAALREWCGNLRAASVQLGVTAEGLRLRTVRMEQRGALPDDVLARLHGRRKRFDGALVGVSDAELAPVLATGTVMDAARRFGVPYATMHRRVAAMRRAGVL